MLRKGLLILLCLAVAGGLVFAGGQGEQIEDVATDEAEAGADRFREGADVKSWVSVEAYEEETGESLPAFKQAPSLDDKPLPSVDERLPDVPSVVEPWESVGKYGGTAAMDAVHVRNIVHRGLFMQNSAGTEIRPDLALGYEYADDYSSVTIFLRPGLKWSDGMPFTADDIIFYFEDFTYNEELNPSIANTKPQEKSMTAIDDHTLLIEFYEPQPGYMAAKSHPYGMGQSTFFAPKHYLTKWHADYNSDAQKIAEEEGYSSWTEAFLFHVARWVYQERENMPTLNPWVITENTATYYKAVRNPYFYQVDTAGNQLPYIDEVTFVKSPQADVQTKIIQVMDGNLDYVSGFSVIPLSDYPFIKENEADGDYRSVLYKGDFASNMTFAFNQNAPDPVLREIFRDKRFREAMSLAMDRDAINEGAYLGLAIPRQQAVLPTVSFYEEEWGDYKIERDVDRANQLLDEMGLEWDEDRNLRLRPDGEPMNLLLESGHGSAPEALVAEIVKNQWEQVGVTLTIRPEKITHERLQQGELYEVAIVDAGGQSTELAMHGGDFLFFAGNMGAYSWWNWLASGGATGTEPPQKWKQVYDWIQEANATVPGTPRWTELKKDIHETRVQSLIQLGTVYGAPIIDLASERLRNLPEGIWFGWATGIHTNLFTQQWYIDE